MACASGMAALYLAVLAAGTPLGSTQPRPRHILAASELYGATHTLLRDFFAAQNVGLSTFDATDPAALEAALGQNEPDVRVLIESLSNPLLKVADVRAIAERVHAAGARLVVDATMASPILHRPLAEGADVVVHSATKFLGGHGDVVGGVLAARTGFMLATAQRYARLLGVGLGPFDARLVSRGMKTLSLRVRQQCANAVRVAEWLHVQPGVARVMYPGLPDHPQHELAARQFGGLFGALVTFELAEGTAERAFRLMDRLELILPATSLGDVYTLISYPAISSHRDVPAEVRHRQGIGDGVLRLSVGIEDAGDIIADLEQALGA